ETGQHHVEHDQLGTLGLPQLQTLLTGGGGRRAVALAGQRELDRHPDGGIVFDEQETRHLPIFTDETPVCGSRTRGPRSPSHSGGRSVTVRQRWVSVAPPKITSRIRVRTCGDRRPPGRGPC